MASLYHIYDALEEEIEHNKENPVYTPLYFPEELHRRAALEQDMAFWYGPRWQEAIPYTQATKRYVRRLQQVGRFEPELLVAHAYTRYMGDLSGGQVLKKVAQRALKLPSTGEGTQFYLFENVDNAQQFKQFYRARMNALDLNLETKEKIVEEANKAFEYNMQVLPGPRAAQTGLSALGHMSAACPRSSPGSASTRGHERVWGQRGPSTWRRWGGGSCPLPVLVMRSGVPPS